MSRSKRTTENEARYLQELRELRQLSKYTQEELVQLGVSKNRTNKLKQWRNYASNQGLYTNLNVRTARYHLSNTASLTNRTLAALNRAGKLPSDLLGETKESLRAIGVSMGQTLTILGWQQNARTPSRHKLTNKVRNLFNSAAEATPTTDAGLELYTELITHDKLRRNMDRIISQLDGYAVGRGRQSFTPHLKKYGDYYSNITKKKEIYYNFFLTKEGVPIYHLSIHKGQIHVKVDYLTHHGRREIRIHKDPNGDYEIVMRCMVTKVDTKGASEVVVLEIVDQIVEKVAGCFKEYYESKGSKCTIKTCT